eukprot:11210932-Lingulodinium_polyedra.AAC.1
MPALEGEAAVFGLRHFLRASRNVGRRVLVLGDSMTVALASDKGRTSSPGLLGVSRRLCAFLLASGCVLRVRWIASESNPADGPSRGSWEASVPRAAPGPPGGGHAAARLGGAAFAPEEAAEA